MHEQRTTLEPTVSRDGPEGGAPQGNADVDLFNRFFAGEDAPLMELFDRHNHRLFMYGLKMLGDRTAAEDLVQDIWEKVIRLRSSGRPVPDNPVGYLLTMTRNLSLNRIRDRRTWDSLDDVAERHVPTSPPAERTYGEELIEAALPHLPEGHREVLVLHTWSGYRFDEIAEMLGEPVGAVRTRAWRARHQLARIVSTFMELDQRNIDDDNEKGRREGDSHQENQP